jgi:hypothetical protein
MIWPESMPRRSKPGKPQVEEAARIVPGEPTDVVIDGIDVDAD